MLSPHWEALEGLEILELMGAHEVRQMHGAAGGALRAVLKHLRCLTIHVRPCTTNPSGLQW